MSVQCGVWLTYVASNDTFVPLPSHDPQKMERIQWPRLIMFLLNRPSPISSESAGAFCGARLASPLGAGRGSRRICPTASPLICAPVWGQGSGRALAWGSAPCGPSPPHLLTLLQQLTEISNLQVPFSLCSVLLFTIILTEKGGP